MSCKIKDGLFMGGADASQDPEFIQLNGIQYIINCVAQELPCVFELDGVNYLRIRLPSSPLSDFFDTSNPVLQDTFAFIDKALNGLHSVLVHSMNGKSRSACIIIAYLMQKYKWGVDKAFEFIVIKKNDLELNTKYVEQLYAFESQLVNEAPDIISIEKLNHWDLNACDLESDERVLVSTYLNSVRRNPEAEMLKNQRRCSHTRKLVWIDECMSDGEATLERPPSASYNALVAGNGWEIISYSPEKSKISQKVQIVDLYDNPIESNNDEYDKEELIMKEQEKEHFPIDNLPLLTVENVTKLEVKEEENDEVKLTSYPLEEKEMDRMGPEIECKSKTDSIRLEETINEMEIGPETNDDEFMTNSNSNYNMKEEIQAPKIPISNEDTTETNYDEENVRSKSFSNKKSTSSSTEVERNTIKNTLPRYLQPTISSKCSQRITKPTKQTIPKSTTPPSKSRNNNDNNNNNNSNDLPKSRPRRRSASNLDEYMSKSSNKEETKSATTTLKRPVTMSSMNSKTIAFELPVLEVDKHTKIIHEKKNQHLSKSKNEDKENSSHMKTIPIASMRSTSRPIAWR